MQLIWFTVGIEREGSVYLLKINKGAVGQESGHQYLLMTEIRSEGLTDKNIRNQMLNCIAKCIRVESFFWQLVNKGKSVQ